jgi:hypothetical protein
VTDDEEPVYSWLTRSMARGFESKDVEFQQAEAERSRAKGRELTPEEREANARRRTLELALTRARTDLASARSDAHRTMLQAAIAALEQQLAAITGVI